jgi:ketosteroid isomerase-like protein
VSQTDIVEVVRDVLDAVASGDAERLIELTDPEVEWGSFFALHGPEYHGHEGIRQYVCDLGSAFEIHTPVPHHLLPIGEVVIGVGKIHYRGVTSGVESESPAGWMFKFRDGRVLRFRAFRNPEERLEEVGLP